METLIAGVIFAAVGVALYRHGKHVGSRAGFGAALRRVCRQGYRRRRRPDR